MMVEIVISHQIDIELGDLSDRFVRAVMDDLTLHNPAYDLAIKQGRQPYNTPEYIELYRLSKVNLTLPRGYGKRLMQQLKQYGVQARWYDLRITLPAVQFRSKINPRPYQEQAIQALIEARQGGVVAPCGAGKTMILLEAMARIGQPALWVTHTNELAEQVIDRAIESLDIPRDEIGRIYGGQATIGPRFTVALVQSLSKLDTNDVRGKFGTVLIDEAHHMAATTFYHPIGQFPAKYRLWASATPERSDGLTEMVFAGAGPILYEIPQTAVPTVTPKLEVVETEFAFHDEDYTRLIAALVADDARNDLITTVISRHARGHYSLVLSDRVEHLEVLAAGLRTMMPDMKVEILTGSMSKAARADVMKRVQTRQVDILLATQLAREGLDIKHLDRLFLATPKRAAGAVQQEVGRVMRPCEGKDSAVVFDFWDVNSPILKAQFWRRREVYLKLGMDVQLGRRKAAVM